MRIALALFVLLGVLFAVDGLFSMFYTAEYSPLDWRATLAVLDYRTPVGMLLGAIAGGFIARRGFVLAALLLWAALWALLVNGFADMGMADGNRWELAEICRIAIIGSLAGAIVGATLGQRLARGIAGRSTNPSRHAS